MGCRLSSRTEVDARVYTSVQPVNRPEDRAGTQDEDAPRSDSLHRPEEPVDEAVQEPVNRAVWQPVSRSALEPAIEDIRDKYDLGNLIGTGTFAQVRTATLKDGSEEVRAVKICESASSEDSPGWRNKDMFETEVQMLQRVNFQCIIQMYEFYEDPHFLYIVMEMCSGGEVFSKLIEEERFTEKMAVSLGRQMLFAIDHIHRLHIVHRDIKAENFMLSSPWITSTVKLIDFGLSCDFQDGVYMTELVGSPHYLAPELIGQRYTNTIDIWAFGVLMFLLVYGRYPFEARNTKELMIKILSEPIRWHTKSRLSPACLEFLGIVLDRYVRKRATATECLEQEWMQPPTRDVRNDAIEISPEIVRSALRHLTDNREQMDPKVRERSSRKLRELDTNWKNGIRNGRRLGVKDKEKPEFVRRENKLVSAPSRQQGSLGEPSEERSDVRSASVVDGRLAAMYELTKRDADDLRRIHREKVEKAKKVDNARKVDEGTKANNLPPQSSVS